MLERLMPKSDEFFDDFEAVAAMAVKGVRLLAALLHDFTDVSTKVKAIKEVEEAGDEATHRAFERLHKQFITPFDRAAIHRLLSRIDDVLDQADAAADRLELYELTEIPLEARQMGDVLVKATEAMERAVKGLRHIKKSELILTACREVNAFENEADALLRLSLARLFKTPGDPVFVIKWKEIYDFLGMATDRCEDVANVLEGVVLEHS